MLEGWLESMSANLDSQQQGYVAWSWNTNTPPLLITDDTTGAPSPDFGVTYQDPLQQVVDRQARPGTAGGRPPDASFTSPRMSLTPGIVLARA